MIDKKQIVIAEDQTLVRQGLRSLVSTDERYAVIGEAKDGLEAVKSVKKHRPDLLLLDLAMPRMNGISAIREIKREYPETHILAITFHTSDEYILEAFQAGADGYCLKNDSHSELMTAIARVLEGKKYLSPAISETVLEGYLEGRKTLKTETTWATLTQREREILKLVGEGYTSKEIAEMLAISSKTVDKHRSNIMNKLDLHSAAALSAYAVEKGIVTKT
jgi:DNA-binding NarL/FixJ family response regulator